MTDHLNIS